MKYNFVVKKVKRGYKLGSYGLDYDDMKIGDVIIHSTDADPKLERGDEILIEGEKYEIRGILKDVKTGETSLLLDKTVYVDDIESLKRAFYDAESNRDSNYRELKDKYDQLQKDTKNMRKKILGFL